MFDCVFFYATCFFQTPNKLNLHVKYISYVLYIYTPICIYIYVLDTINMYTLKKCIYDMYIYIFIFAIHQQTKTFLQKNAMSAPSFVLFHRLQGGRRVRTSEVGSAGEVPVVRFRSCSSRFAIRCVFVCFFLKMIFFLFSNIEQ